jgi:hypothetical protein
VSGRWKVAMVVLTKVGVVLAALVAGALLAGCSMDRWVEVEDGEYAVVRELGDTNGAAVREVPRLEIDREAGQMVFTLVDGSRITVSFVARDRAAWPAGCPTNIQSTRMEVLEIAADPLSLGSTEFRQPVLVRDCPRKPVRLVLREDGKMGGAGTACPYGEICLYFAPEATGDAATLQLPHSGKGYELYSWKEGQEWHFSLMTGTNRLKTYEEIVSGAWIPAEDIVTESEWVAITAQGLEEVTTLLGRLPRGETVTWRGAGWLKQAGRSSGDLQLPGPEVVEEVADTCRELGIELQVAN